MNRMTSPRNKSKVIKVLCPSCLKCSWFHFLAVSIVFTCPLKSPVWDFVHMFLKTSTLLTEYCLSRWKYRTVVGWPRFILALLYSSACRPYVQTENVETLNGFCKYMALSTCLLSFLSTWRLLLNLKTKSKDAKDKEKLSRHQFVPGTFSGVLQCSVCDKTLLGKESFQCSSKFLGPVCAVFAFCVPRQ